MAKTAKQILEGMLNLFQDADKWTQGEFAKHREKAADGTVKNVYSVSPLSKKADCFCLLGGLDYVSGTKYSVRNQRYSCGSAGPMHLAAYEAESILKKTIMDEGSDSVALFNDNVASSVEDIRDVLRQAIASIDNKEAVA